MLVCGVYDADSTGGTYNCPVDRSGTFKVLLYTAGTTAHGTVTLDGADTPLIASSLLAPPARAAVATTAISVGSHTLTLAGLDEAAFVELLVLDDSDLSGAWGLSQPQTVTASNPGGGTFTDTDLDQTAIPLLLVLNDPNNPTGTASLQSYLIFLPTFVRTPLITFATGLSIGGTPIKLGIGSAHGEMGSIAGLGVEMGVGTNRQLYRMDFHVFNPGHGGATGLRGNESMSSWVEGMYHFHVYDWNAVMQ